MTKVKRVTGVWIYEASQDHSAERLLLEPDAVSPSVADTIMDELAGLALGNEWDGTPELGCGRFEMSLDGREVDVSVDVLSVRRNDGSYKRISNRRARLAVMGSDYLLGATSARERGVREGLARV